MKVTEVENFADLAKFVSLSGHVVRVKMKILRNLSSKQKLGVRVVKQISTDLKRFGLHHRPQQLPKDQSSFITVYAVDSKVGHIVDAVEHLSTKKGADFLKSL